MKGYAPIAPIGIYEQMKARGILGKYHLLLAHEVVKAPQRYGEVFNTPGMFIIMDNSLCELGHPVDVNIMMDACAIVKSSCMVLADVLEDSDATVKASQEYADTLSQYVTGPFMGVVQGKSISDALFCHSQLKKIPGVEYFGVPRVVANTMTTRMGVIKAISEKCNIHLLGMSTRYADDMWCAQHPNVMGIDSANPLSLGFKDVCIDKINWYYPHIDRNDFWQAEQLTSCMMRNILNVRHFINEE